MNLIEAVATPQTRLVRRSKQWRARDESVDRRPKLRAIAILLHQQFVLGALKGNCISHHELAGRNQFAKQLNSTLRRLVAGLGSFGPAGISGNIAAGCAVDQWEDLILDRLNPA